jgi:CARDB
VEPTMRRTSHSVLVLALVLGVAFAGLALAGTPARAAATTPVTGSVSGPTVLALGGTGHYTIVGTGGPAVAPNGTQVGNITYYITLAATNLTGVSVTPAQAALGPNLNGTPILIVGAITEVVTMTVMISSVYQHQNVSTNLTYSVTVVQPYVVTATLVNVSDTTVLAFPLAIYLDGNPVATVEVSSMTPGNEYNLSYQYATTGLSSGDHTFTISLAAQHGLVVFSNGAQSYSQTFYVTGPAPNYTIWYVVGIVAFVGVLFIFLTRVAARRRGALRR